MGDVAKLAPSGWQRNRPKKVVDIFSTRLVQIAGAEPRRWEWVSPLAGILLYSADGAPTQVTGHNLFGTETWGAAWENGYQPLGRLDADGDGVLTGAELNCVYIWVDANGDGKPDPGEIVPASWYVDKIATRAIEQAGDASQPVKGAQLLNGNWVGSWDWWSRPATEFVGEHEAAVVGQLDKLSLYAWHAVADPLHPSEADAYAGYLRFMFEDGKPLVAGMSSKTASGLVASVSPLRMKSARMFEWMFDGICLTRAYMTPDGVLHGMSRPAKGYGPSYRWEAKPVQGEFPDNFAASFAAADPFDAYNGLAQGKLFWLAPVEASAYPHPTILPLSEVFPAGYSNYKILTHR